MGLGGCWVCRLEDWSANRLHGVLAPFSQQRQELKPLRPYGGADLPLA